MAPMITIERDDSGAKHDDLDGSGRTRKTMAPMITIERDDSGAKHDDLDGSGRTRINTRGTHCNHETNQNSKRDAGVIRVHDTR